MSFAEKLGHIPQIDALDDLNVTPINRSQLVLKDGGSSVSIRMSGLLVDGLLIYY